MVNCTVNEMSQQYALPKPICETRAEFLRMWFVDNCYLLVWSYCVDYLGHGQHDEALIVAESSPFQDAHDALRTKRGY